MDGDTLMGPRVGSEPTRAVEHIDLVFSQRFPLLVCTKCEMTFVLLAAFRGGVSDDGDRYGASWMDQIETKFCPYCGAKW